MKKSTMLAVALVSSSVVSGSQAFADGGFGKGMQLVLSADRLFGLSFTSMSEEPETGGGTTTISRTNIAMFWPPLSVETYSPYVTPHLGFDVVVPGGFTVGGSLGFVSGTGKTKVESSAGGSVEQDDGTLTILAVAPRVGFAVPLTSFIAFWPRVGGTIYSISSESTGQGATPTTNKTSLTGIGLNLEPMFVLSPADHFGIVAGPVVDIPLTGKSSTTRTPAVGVQQPDTNVKFMNFGLTVGLLGYF
jgi:hypothetical protein